MRASKRPYACSNLPCVFSRAEVYWHTPYQQRYLFPSFSLWAAMTRLPAPSIDAFFVALVSYSRWWLPQPFEPLPTSATHFVPSTPDPAVPLNSSLHASVHVVCAAAVAANTAHSRAATPKRAARIVNPSLLVDMRLPP